MLQAVASLAPRGVYVCGNTTTTAGLTVTLHKDSTGDYALEAGLFVQFQLFFKKSLICSLISYLKGH